MADLVGRMDGKRNTVCGGYLWSCVMPFLVYSSWWRPRFGGEGEVCLVVTIFWCVLNVKQNLTFYVGIR
jgi:hypothetical protein